MQITSLWAPTYLDAVSILFVCMTVRILEKMGKLNDSRVITGCQMPLLAAATAT